MLKKKLFFLAMVVCAVFFFKDCNAQVTNDSSTIRIDSMVSHTRRDNDSGKSLLALDTSLQKHNPRIATLRSAILPGWGQAYNKKYWKIPIVYGALGTTAAVFLYNLKTYKSLKQAYIYISDKDTANDALIESRFRNLSPESIRSYRTSFRQNVDYSVLFFLIFWGLNVVDATVDGHLKAFDVSNDITLKIRPRINYSLPGVSLILSFRDKPAKQLSSLP